MLNLVKKYFEYKEMKRIEEDENDRLLTEEIRAYVASLPKEEVRRADMCVRRNIYDRPSRVNRINVGIFC